MTQSSNISPYYTFSNRWLWVGRITWALMFAIGAILLAMGAYSWYAHQSESDCAAPVHANWLKEYCEPYYQAISDFGLSPQTFGGYIALLYVFAGAPYFVLSFILVFRRSHTAFTLLFALFLIAIGTTGKMMNPLPDWAAGFTAGTAFDLTWPANFVRFFLTGLGPLILCAFPDGRFVPRWTRWLLVLVWVPLAFLDQFFDSPLSYNEWSAPWPQVIDLLFIGVVLYAVLYRYRRDADVTQRQQIKWFLLGVVLVIANYLIDYFVWQVYPLITGQTLITAGRPAVLWELIQGTVWGVSEVLLAVCVAFSIFRYRLFDIDLIIRRTVLWAIVSGLGLVVYLLAVGATSFFLSSPPDYVIPLVALVLVALIARPVYRRLDNWLNRLLSQKSSAVEDEG